MSNSCGRKSPTSRQPMISMITGKSHMQLWFNMINPNKGPNQKTTDMNPRRRFVASKSRRNCLGNLDKYEYTFTAFTYHIFYVVYPNQPAQFLRIIHTIRPSTISHTISISTLYLVLHCRSAFSSRTPSSTGNCQLPLFGSGCISSIWRDTDQPWQP